MSNYKKKRYIILYFLIIILGFVYINFKFGLISNNRILIKKGKFIKGNKVGKGINAKGGRKRSRYDRENIITNINTENWINNQYIVTKKDRIVLENMVGEERKYTNAIINEFQKLGFENTRELNKLAKKYFKEERGLDKLGDIYLEDKYICIYFFYHKYNLETDFNELAKFYMYENNETALKNCSKVGVYSIFKKTNESVYYYDGILIFQREVEGNKFKYR